MESRFTHVSVLGAISLLFNYQHKTALTTVGMKTHPKNTVPILSLQLVLSLSEGFQVGRFAPTTLFTIHMNEKF